jgi:PDZ domain
VYTPVPGMGIFGGGGSADAPVPGGLHMPFFGSSLKVGALVEPLTSQMAEYLGVSGGLMVKQVVNKSEAAAAGFKAFDVILKVGTEGIATTADWDRALRANQGKPVLVTILRDKKQQTLTLRVDSKRKGEVDFEELFPSGDCPLIASIDPEMVVLQVPQLSIDESAVQSMPSQAGGLSDEFGSLQFQISPEQAEQFRKQAEQFRDAFKDRNFQIDQEQLDKLKHEMEQWRQSFKPEDFKFDQKQMDQMKRQMEQFRKDFKPEDFKIDQKQLDQMRQQMEQLKRQLEEVQALGFSDHV